jgi:hypothetical protein
MQTLRSFVIVIATYGAWIERLDSGNYYLIDRDGSVLESFCVTSDCLEDELAATLLDFQASALLEKLKIYRLTRSVAQQMEHDESYLS